jgi:acetyl esterase/lipase
VISRRRFLVALTGAAVTSACGSGSEPRTRQPHTTGGHRVSRTVESYGPQRLNRGEWFVPAGDGPAPTVVLVHGGYWRAQYDRSLEEPVAADLASRGYLVWNIDYRPSTSPWPDTFLDVAAAYDHLPSSRFSDRVDPSRLAVVGHSAGGHLAAWLASRHRLPAGAPGHSPTLTRPALFVPQAGVVALTLAAQQHLGNDAAQALLDGSPEQVPDRYRDGDPVDLLPTGIRSVLIHGTSDTTVPLSQSETYNRDALGAGDPSSLDLVPGDHFVHLDPTSEAVVRLRDALASMTA